MNVLYFTIFTGIESILPGTSNLGVTIKIGFCDMMQRERKGKFKEVLFPDMHESTLCGDTVSIMTRSLSGMKSAVTRCLPHYFLLGEQPELLIALFPIM